MHQFEKNLLSFTTTGEIYFKVRPYLFVIQMPFCSVLHKSGEIFYGRRKSTIVLLFAFKHYVGLVKAYLAVVIGVGNTFAVVFEQAVPA